MLQTEIVDLFYDRGINKYIKMHKEEKQSNFKVQIEFDDD